jgi:predicted NUDIX family NTP pyrophosphohydrolase
VEGRGRRKWGRTLFFAEADEGHLGVGEAGGGHVVVVHGVHAALDVLDRRHTL